MTTKNLHFKTFRAKNLATIGDHFITIHLDRNPTTVIYGDNGVSKSSLMCDGIMFCLYNKPFKKIKIGELVNNVNRKGLLTEITFNKGSDEYTVTRGYNPKVFTITKNGNLLPDTTDLQSYLEENILGIPFNTFKQIVVMGKANYQSFLDLPKDKRREFVETILDISVFRDMLNFHKEEIKRNEQELLTVSIEEEQQEKAVSNTTSIYKTMQNEKETEFKKEIEELLQQKEELQTELNSLRATNLKEIQINMKRVEKKMKSLQENIHSINVELNMEEKAISKLDKYSTCPTCKQTIDEKHKNHLHSHFASLKETKDEQLSALQTEVEKCRRLEEALDCKYNDEKAVEYNRERLEKELSTVENKLTKLLDKSSKKEDDALFKKVKLTLKNTINELKATREKKAALQSTKEIHTLASSLLSDKGMKTVVINRFLPQINHFINKNLSDMGLFATIKFDEEFKDDIRKRGFDEFSFNQLSEGEKLRLDLSIMLAWRQIASLKSNLSINLMILDEVFNNSMDYKGAKAFIDILNNTEGQSAFIISPSANEILDLCRGSIYLSKKDGFTIIDQAE